MCNLATLPQFKDAEQSRRCALAGPYGMRLIGTIMRSFVRVVPVHSEGKYHSICEGLIDLIHTQIASQTRAQGSFHSLLPTEVLKIIIGFVYIHETSRVDLALVHPVWRDIALPLLWNSIFVEFDHDAEVKFFAQVARRTSYITRRLYIHAGETRNKVISVDRAIMALKGLRKLTAVTSTMSMSVFASPSMAELSDLTLHLVEVSDAISTTAIPFHLRSLEITGKHYDEDAIDSLLTAIANGSSTTLERLSLDSPQAAQKHLAAFSRNLVELSLTGLSKFNPSELDLPLLRKLTLPRSELHTLLALPPADAPPDALRSTISQTIPHLENLTVSYSGYQMGHEDLLNLDRLLRLPLCNALRALTLEEAEFDEDLNQSGLEVFRKMVVYCEERGVVVKVNGESLC
ncbi:hypothetical protein RQP46_006330 [Phenoliferia psychrophenolica]